MNDRDFDSIYAKVPAQQRDLLRDFRANHPYREVPFKDTPWRYVACGQGTRTLLFLPGGFMRADMWFHAIMGLERDYRIIVPDSYTLQGTFDIEDVGRAIVQILDAEGVDRATVIGLSAGGGIAQYLVQEYPEQVENVVLSHCGIVEGSAESEDGAEVEKQIQKTLRLVKLLPLFVTRRVLLKRTTGEVAFHSEWQAFHDAYVREAANRMTKEMAVGFVQGAGQMRRSFVFKPEVLQAWPGEMLIMTSRDDKLSMSKLENLQARYPRARTKILGQGGHHTFLFFPEAYTEALRGFLAGVS